MKKPKYSIIIPAYNEAHYIADTITSLQSQDYPGNYEIIVVDNNSSDQTHTIAKRLGVVVTKEKHPGVCWARQKGLELAKGEIIVSADADTYYKPDWLTKIDRQFAKNPKAVGVVGGCIYANGPLWTAAYVRILFGTSWLVYKLTGRTYYASATNLAFKRSSFEAYDTSLTQGGDELDVLSKLRKKGRVIFYYKNPAYTSPRRQMRGFVYNFFVTFWYYYIFEYYLSKIFNSSVIGRAPTIRTENLSRRINIVKTIVTVALILMVLLYTKPGHFLVHKAENITERSENAVRKSGDRL